MAWLILSVALLVASHAAPSIAGTRAAVTARVGKSGFYILYSALSAGALAATIASYRAAGDAWIYAPELIGRHIALAAMPVALLLLTCRFTQRPDIGGGASRGVYRITTTPGSLAVLIWSAAHLANMGQARQIVLFLGMAAIAIFAIARNARRAGLGLYGVVPFARILGGDQRFVWAEIGWARVALALALYAALLLLHPLVVGPDPLAGISF